MRNIVVIGGGPAGMMAALAAAKRGNAVTLIEQNEKLGKKLFITGKGRCNVTNACETEELLKHVASNPKFLYSAFYTFSNDDVQRLFAENGCPLKTERGNRVFPVSDHSSDVIKTMEKLLLEAGVSVLLETTLTELTAEEGHITRVTLRKKSGGVLTLSPDSVILATGGKSYESTGSDGKGMLIAEKLGHKLKPLYPSLVPFETEDTWCYALSGLTLKNVGVRALSNGKTVFSDFGELLFTHFGISGPTVLTASTVLTQRLHEGEKIRWSVDLKPALTIEQLSERLLRDFSGAENKLLKNIMNALVPSALGPILLMKAGIPAERFVRDVTREERLSLVREMKNLTVTVSGTRGFSEAIITKGGVSVRDVEANTMRSKVIDNLYLSGEMLDLDAETGGFNLQIAWSTGYLAGMNA